MVPSSATPQEGHLKHGWNINSGHVLFHGWNVGLPILVYLGKRNSMFVKCVRTGDPCQFSIAPGMEILSELTTNRSKSYCVSIFGSWVRLKMAYTPEKWNSEKKSTAWKIDLGIPRSLTNPCAL
jgi:hypothetical protein